jgi:hypothetical protein
LQHIQTSINPRTADSSASTINKDPCFSIVQRAHDHLGPTKAPESDVCEHIADQRLNANLRVDSPGAASGAFRFWLAFIFFSKEHGATKVAQLNPVHVDDDQVAYAEKAEVLDHLVAEGARSYDEHSRILDERLVPPTNGLESGEASL